MIDYAKAAAELSDAELIKRASHRVTREWRIAYNRELKRRGLQAPALVPIGRRATR